ncbi:MAG: hypothetical protein HFE64_02545 [Lachnospiraceae bacterium]|nr:hypothetical protein [Lachnospiraceae bacterium]
MFFTVIIIIALVLVGLYFLGKKMQKKQAASMQIVEQNKQTISALIIDKKKIRISQANMPKSVMEQVPKRMRFQKVPLVKVKVGPQILTMFSDKQVFEALPVKKIVKLEVSGGYIMSFNTAKKGEKKVEFERKLTWREKLANKVSDMQSKK